MREKTGDIILPLLFATALVTLTLSVYTRWAPLFALPVLAGVRLVFFLCAWLKQKRTAISVLAYLAVGALTALPFYLISLGVSRDPFALADQLKNGSPAAPGLIALAALLCFFTASGVYYCTRVNITLTTAAFIIIIPCMLYASRLTLVPPVYAAIVIPLFIAVLIDCRRSEATQGLSLINLRPYCLIIGAAAVLLAAAALIMPKADVTPFDYFRLLYGNYERLSARSGDNPPERADNERPLFEVRATEPLYLKRQVFGVFTLGGWNVVADNFFIARDGWETERARLGVNNLLRLIRQAAELDADFAARYAPDGFLPAAGAGAATARTAEIRHLGMRSTYIPHPETSFEVTGLPAGELALQMPTGELLLYNSRLPGDVIYNLSYYSQIPEEHVLAFLESFNYERLLSDMEKVFNRANQSRAWTEVRTFETERRQAAEFQAATPILPPERAAGLAVLTTAGLRSDFAKAAAIENFFHENGYVYDLDFSPPRNYEDDIEYFIFSSRRGACSDFATAMTLMARAAGLNARYVEGFYAPPPGGDGLSLVTGGSAHAYVEVFLPGYGWTVFEPTASYEEERGAKALGEIGEQKWALLFSVCLLAVAAATAFFRYILLPARREAAFRRQARGAGAREGLILLYLRVQAMLSRRGTTPVQPYTPRMLADFVRQKYGADLRPLTEPYERAAFAGALVSENDFAAALQVYRLFCRARPVKRDEDSP